VAGGELVLQLGVRGKALRRAAGDRVPRIRLF
jgi:hypothetical protein